MNNERRPQAEETVDVNGVPFTHRDLFRVVDDFYTRIQRDPILQIPFSSVHDWPEHIERLTHFWWIRFGGAPYLFSQYNPVAKHFFAGFSRDLLTRWLSIFHATLKEHLAPEQAALWTSISARMGEALLMKNDSFRRHYEAEDPGRNRGNL